jgi:hypothetical protein
LGEGDTGAERLENAGLTGLAEQDGEVVIDTVGFGSPAEAAGLEFDQKITSVQVPADQPWKELMFIPAMAVLWLIIWLQRRRRASVSPVPAEA